MGRKKILAMVSANQSGIIDCGDENGDKHRIGIDADGNVINAAHLPLGVYFKGNRDIDGPLHFDGMWEDGGAGPIRKIVHFEWDGGEAHPFVCGERNGQYKWHSYCEAYTVTPPPGIPTGGCPPKKPPPKKPPPGIPTDTPTGGPPPNGGPPGGGPPPPFPPTPTGGGFPSIPGGIIEIENIDLDIESFQTFTKGMPAKAFSAFSMEMATSGILGRPQFAQSKALDFRNLMHPKHCDVAKRDAETPIIGRIESYGRQTPSGWTYTDRPNKGARYPGGTAEGGFALFPPQVDIADVSTSFEPTDKTISDTFFTFAPQTRLAFGRPDTGTGKLKMGMGFLHMSTNLITELDPSGISALGDLGITKYTSTATESLSFVLGHTTAKIGFKGTGSNWGQMTHEATATRTWTFPDKSGTVAMTSDITSGVTGSGTVGTVPKWTGASALGDSLITESGTTVTITGKLTVTGAIDPPSLLLSGGTALFFESNDGSTAPVSGAATGRLRYNNSTGFWQSSVQGGAYSTIWTAANDGAGSGLDADLLDGLSSTAFLILAGQSGGQTAYGGTAASNKLILRSTSNATKGNIEIGDDGIASFFVGNAASGSYMQFAGSGVDDLWKVVDSTGKGLTFTLSTLELFFSDAAAAATTGAGFMRRNGANITWHNGTVGTNLIQAATLTAKGDIYAATASNAVTRLAVGSNDQVLTADSTQATGLKWAAAGGAPTNSQYVTLATDGTLSAERVLTAGTGITLTDAGAGSTVTVDADWDLLQTATASNSATIDLTTGISSTYTSYKIEISKAVPATDNVILYLRYSTDGGSTWKAGASDYQWSWGYTTFNSTGHGGASAGGTEIQMYNNIGNASGEGFSATITINDPSTASPKTFAHWNGSYLNASGNSQSGFGGGFYQTATAINGFRLLMSSGNITSGTFKLYGIR